MGKMSFQERVLGQLDIHMEENETWPLLHTITQFQVDCRSTCNKTIKFLEECFCVLGGKKYFLRKSPKALNIKKKIITIIILKSKPFIHQIISIRKYKCNPWVEKYTCYTYHYIENHPKIMKRKTTDKNIWISTNKKKKKRKRSRKD